MEQTECSETSAYKLQTPGNYPKESVQHTEHGESLKSSEVRCLTVCGMRDRVYPFHSSIVTWSVIHRTCVRQPGDLLESTKWSRIHTAFLLTQTSGKEESLLSWWPELPFSISERRLLASVCHVGMTSNEIYPFIQRTDTIIAWFFDQSIISRLADIQRPAFFFGRYTG